MKPPPRRAQERLNSTAARTGRPSPAAAAAPQPAAEVLEIIEKKRHKKDPFDERYTRFALGLGVVSAATGLG